MIQLLFVMIMSSIMFGQERSDFKFIKNVNDEITHLYLEEQGLDEFISFIDMTNQKVNLNTLSIIELETKLTKIKNLSEFFQTYAKNLKVVYFEDFGTYGKVNELAYFLQCVEGLGIKEFSWVKQKSITKMKDLNTIKDYESFWSNLNKLSFLSTEIDEDILLIDSLKLSNLTSLNLSNTNLEKEALKKLIDISENYPKLNCLELSYNVDLLESVTKNSIPSLKTFIFYTDNDLSTEDVNQFIRNNTAFLSNLDHFYMDFEYFDNFNYGFFQAKTNRSNGNYQTKVQKPIFQLINPKSTGLFTRKIDEEDLQYLHSKSHQQNLIISKKDLNNYQNVFNKHDKDIVFIGGNELMLSEISEFIKHYAFKTVVLTGTEFEDKHIAFLDETYPEIQFIQYSTKMLYIRSNTPHYTPPSHFNFPVQIPNFKN